MSHEYPQIKISQYCDRPLEPYLYNIYVLKTYEPENKQDHLLRGNPELIIIHHTTGNLLMKMKVGNVTQYLPACHAHVISATTAIPPAILAATITNMECHVGLCLLADGIQF
jgi:hypothetical protein